MCFHSSLVSTPSRLSRRYGRSDEKIRDFRPIYHASAFTYPELPIATAGPDLLPARWGLIPFWVRDAEEASELRRRTFNARGETVFSKPAFRSLVGRDRCLVPSTGFFDWRHEGNSKIPYFIGLEDEEIFSLAGLHSTWKLPGTDESVETFTVITCPANRLMRYIHNTNFRMPVVLTREEEERWLDPGLTDRQIEAFMQPINDELMTAYRIRNGFLRLSPYDPSVLEPAEESPRVPGSRKNPEAGKESMFAEISADKKTTD